MDVNLENMLACSSGAFPSSLSAAFCLSSHSANPEDPVFRDINLFCIEILEFKVSKSALERVLETDAWVQPNYQLRRLRNPRWAKIYASEHSQAEESKQFNCKKFIMSLFIN
jgi:hypothetical protein